MRSTFSCVTRRNQVRASAAFAGATFAAANRAFTNPSTVSALTAGNALEMALLAEMLKTRTHVPVEQALSGPGLLNLHAALCAVRGVAPSAYTHPGQITAAAQSGEDALARESLEVFCGLLGSVVGDMALLYGVQGGVYLAGGILPKIRDFLIQSSFVGQQANDHIHRLCQVFGCWCPLSAQIKQGLRLGRRSIPHRQRVTLCQKS